MSKLRHLAFLAALSMGVAAAAGTPVGTNITNQASASYTDPDGGAQTTNSNTVTTQVAPLPGVSITPNEDLPGAVSAGRSLTRSPGEQVAIPYTIANTGNFDNSYTLTTFVDKLNSSNVLESVVVSFYIDNGTTPGVLDASDTLVINPLNLVADNPATLAVEGTASLLMVYTLPSLAPVGATLVIEPVATATVSSVTANATTFTGIPLVSDGARLDDGASPQLNPSVPNDVLANGTNENGITVIPDNFHKVTVQAGAIINATKTVVGYFSDAAATTAISGSRPAVGNFIRYRVEVANTGPQAVSGVTLTDTLQAGTSYVSGSFVSPATGTVGVAGAPQVVTGTLSGNLAAGSVSTPTIVALEIVVKIDSVLDGPDSGTANDPINNSATVTGTDEVSGNSLTSTDAIPTPTDVAALELGPNAKPLGNAVVGAADDYAQTQPMPNGASVAPVYTVVADNDVQTITSVALDSGVGPAGDTIVVFKNTVLNDGTASDSFTLSSGVTPAAAPFPAGTTITFYKDNGDGVLGAGDTLITVTDPVAAGGTFTYLTVVTFPAGTAPTTTDVDITLTATAVSNPLVSNTTRDVIGALTKGMTAGNDTSGETAPPGYDNNGGVDSTAVETQPGTAGTAVTFPMDLVNNGASPATVTLASSVTFPGINPGDPAIVVPVIYYPSSADTDGDGVLSASEAAAATPITSIIVQPGQEATVLAYIPVPANTGSGSIPVNQVFTDTTNGNVVVATPVNVISVSANNFTFTPSSSDTITTAGSTVYTHNLTNLTSSANPISSFTLSASGIGEVGDIGDQSKFDVYYSINGGTTYVLLPAGGNSGVITVPGGLATGASLPVLVKVVNKGGSVVGDQNKLVLTLDPFYGTGNPDPAVQAVTDTTLVQITSTTGTVDLNGDGIIDLKDNPLNYALAPIKSADKTQAKPGENIVYTITATNTRQDPATLTNASISDTIPTNTEFVSLSASCTAGTPVYKFNGGSWQASATPPIAANLVTSVAVGCDTNAPSPDITTADTLASGATITVTLTVKVK